jgi:hypothetical protein
MLAVKRSFPVKRSFHSHHPSFSESWFSAVGRLVGCCLRECGAVVDNRVLLLDEPLLLASAACAAAKAALCWFARLFDRSFDFSGDSATPRV